MYRSVLTVCIGNICRSPMAEGLLKAHIAAAGKDCRIESAGIAAVVDAPAEPFAVTLMRRRGIDIGNHRGRQLTYELLREFELILVMEERHRLHIEQLTPLVKGRVYRVGHWEDFEIRDPYRQPEIAFENALTLIDRGLESWQKYLS